MAPANRFFAKRGRLFIVSAPSGAGKSTLCAMLRQRIPDLAYSVSHTTRAMRPGEKDGIDYFFIDEAAFREGIASGRWVEWAEVHGNFYGTSAAFIEGCLTRGKDLLLDIDVQGMNQLRRRYPEAVTIFIMPPSLSVLRQRLEQRGTETPEAIARRLSNASDEMAQRSQYRHVLVNDDLSRVAKELTALVEGYRQGGEAGNSPADDVKERHGQGAHGDPLRSPSGGRGP